MSVHLRKAIVEISYSALPLGTSYINGQPDRELAAIACRGPVLQ
jgi:hypothetical protein